MINTSSRSRRPFQLLFATLLSFPLLARADVRPASLFQDHMVLQRDVKVPVWGTAAPDEKVTVTFAGQTKTATGDVNGKWSTSLDPLPASATPAELTIAAANTVTIKDVLVGEVWLASGQSNMTLWFDPKTYPEEVATADRPTLREFNVVMAGNLKPQDRNDGRWSVCTPTSLGQNVFSGVAFFFAKELQAKLNVPVGIIHSSFGGSPAEAWVSYEAMAKTPAFREIADRQLADMAARPEEERTFPARLAAWQAAHGSTDDRNTGVEQGWEKPGADLSNWTDVKLPAGFTQMGIRTGGVVWVRKDFKTSPGTPGKPFDMNVGWTEDSIDTYWNGTRIPDTDPFANRNLTVHVPGELVKEGPTTVAFRIYSNSAGGRLWRRTKDLGLPVAADDASQDVWKCRVEKQFPALDDAARRMLPKAPQAVIQYTATCLFNSQINPLIPYAMRGAIWYQGESNASRANAYAALLTTLIRDWRDRWNEGPFPFYIVQLANYGPPATQPVEDDWSALREAQARVAEDVPNCGLAVAIDVGDARTIHPTDKKDVGIRLALNALAKTYGVPVEYSGPVFSSMAVEGRAIRVKFTHADGLQAKGGPLKQFSIAGEDGRYVWADAVIDGQTVVVSSPSVEKPADVRYAWAKNPEGANLYNGAGLPAVPFRSDAPEFDGPSLPLKNAAFGDPSIAPAPYKYGVRAADWEFAGSDSGIGTRSDSASGQMLFWNDPHGSVKQEIPATDFTISGGGEKICLRFRCGGQGAGAFNLTTRLLVGGKPVVSHEEAFDHPDGLGVRRLSYATVPADKGMTVGVEFAPEQTSQPFVQAMISDVVLTAAAPRQ